MGASESRPEGDGNAPKLGYHVIRVAQKSPAQHAGFEPFFDFCVGINGQSLVNVTARPPVASQTNQASFPTHATWQMIEKMEGQMITLNVWNSKRQEYRDVNLVPSRAWAETHTSSQDQPSLLGLTLRLCNPLDTISHVWHVLDVVEGSPADSAGLVPYGDYILGWTGGPLQKEHDFFQLVEQYANHNLALYVYNSDYDHTREVVIMPNRDWGGEGLLGCGIGFGLLHRIPKPQKQWEDPNLGSAYNEEPTYQPEGAPETMDAYASSIPAEPPAPAAQYASTGVTLNIHEEEEE